MITDEIVVFMNEAVNQAGNYELVTDGFVMGLDAMAELLKDFDPESTIGERQDLIDAALLHAAGEAE